MSLWKIKNSLSEECGKQNKIVISRFYIDNGFGSKRFDCPAFQKMLQDIQMDKIDCVVVKGLSRLGRGYITVGYYLEIFFQARTSGLYQLTISLTPPTA